MRCHFKLSVTNQLLLVGGRGRDILHKGSECMSAAVRCVDVVFLIVKALNKLAEIGKKKEEEAPAAPPAPPAPSAEEVLLTEIRDLLKDK